MKLVVFDPEAQSEFFAAVQYYEECQQGLGRHFRHAVESAVKKISDTPFMYRMLHAPFRRHLLLKFPCFAPNFQLHLFGN